MHFVSVRADSAVDLPTADDVGGLLAMEWTGFIALLGPETKDSAKASAKKDPFAHMSGSGLFNGFARSGPEIAKALQNDDTLEFHINAVFVDPSVRRAGIGMALIEATLAEAEEQTRRQGLPSFEITIYVDKYNDPAVTLYQKAGFVALGEETYTQQGVAPDTGEVRVVKREALLMEVWRQVSHA